MVQIKKVRELKPRFRVIDRQDNKKSANNGIRGNGEKSNGFLNGVSGASSDELVFKVAGGSTEQQNRRAVRVASTAFGEGVRASRDDSTGAVGGTGDRSGQVYAVRGGAADASSKYNPARMQQSFLQNAESQEQLFRQRNALHQRDLTANSSNGRDEERKYYEMEKKKPESEERRRRPWWV